MSKEISVLGTKYLIKYATSEEYHELKEMDGFTDTSTNTIVVDNMQTIEGEVGSKADLERYRNQVVRHEIIHAFLHESGLGNNTLSFSNWAVNEEMVDWFALQSPKIYMAFVEADVCK